MRQAVVLKPTAKKIFDFLYGPFFTVLDFFMRHYKANRVRLDNFISKEKVSSFLQGLAVLILVIWIVVFYFAPEDKRKLLTQEVQQSFEKLKPGTLK
ncbi:MAG: hypothetical protein ACI845_001296 [Gammaproteobacteria bacterium]|jgi:hypothetical protein